MAKPSQPTGLSAGFNVARLAAIGPYTIDLGSMGGRFASKVLLIEFGTPPILANTWIPGKVVFEVEFSKTLGLDPDNAMFDLWDQFAAGHATYLQQLKDLTDEATEMNAPTRDFLLGVFRSNRGKSKLFVEFRFGKDENAMRFAHFTKKGFESLDWE
jgi:hypothetical protein